MIYTIVFNDGSIKRLLEIDGFQRTTNFIRFFHKKKTYTYPCCRIASVVFYP